jgi:hypothetical protein
VLIELVDATTKEHKETLDLINLYLCYIPPLFMLTSFGISFSFLLYNTSSLLCERQSSM